MADSKNYIDNIEFYNEIVEYQKDLAVSEKLGIKIRVPEKLGTMISLLCEKNTHIDSYRNYPREDKEDMRTDASIACIKALKGFDTTRNNPFAYFTRIVHNAFTYYLKQKYKNDNFKLELIESEYIKANKPFNNEIKKDMIESKKRKSKKHQEVTL